MMTNRLDNAELNSNSPEKTLRSTAPELDRQFYHKREHSGIKFELGHALRENNLTKRITSLMSGKRKKNKMHMSNCKQIADI